MKIDYMQSTTPKAFGSGARHETSGRALVDAISVTAEVCGQPLSAAAAEMLAKDLGNFEESVIQAALARCRMELQGPLKMADILVRVEDGRPDVDEAWSMMPQSEQASVVWTDEMAQAWGLALPLLSAGDIGGAHTAFREAYAKAVLDARIRRKPVHWTPSLGSDVTGRKRVLLDAVRKGRLSRAHVEQLLPAGAASSGMEAIVAQVKFKNLH